MHILYGYKSGGDTISSLVLRDILMQMCSCLFILNTFIHQYLLNGIYTNISPKLVNYKEFDLLNNHKNNKIRGGKKYNLILYNRNINRYN